MDACGHERSRKVKRSEEVAKKLSLGKAIDRLEEIVKGLESEELELEEALRLFDEGMELIRAAERELTESEGRIKQVLIDRRGTQQEADVELEEESGEP
jgi:exodeoxyribonuclease VII small subunit